MVFQSHLRNKTWAQYIKFNNNFKNKSTRLNNDCFIQKKHYHYD